MTVYVQDLMAVVTLPERGYGQDVATLVNLAPKPLERRQPHEPVTVGRIQPP